MYKNKHLILDLGALGLQVVDFKYRDKDGHVEVNSVYLGGLPLCGLIDTDAWDEIIKRLLDDEYNSEWECQNMFGFDDKYH